MAIPESVKEKIRALSLKTVVNGASAAEETSARDMIRRLAEKYDVPETKADQPRKQSDFSRDISSNKKHPRFEDDPLKGQSLKTFVKSKVAEIDWDLVAKHRLATGLDYFDYLHETHPWWEKHERTKRGMVRSTDAENYVTESEYRIKCFEAFTKIYEERK